MSAFSYTFCFPDFPNGRFFYEKMSPPFYCFSAKENEEKGKTNKQKTPKLQPCLRKGMI